MKRLIRRFMRQFRYGEKGFTLIELLVVIAILGVIAAVVVPNVGRFMGKGKTESGVTELHNIQTAMTAMMADQSPILSTVTVVAAANATNDMTAFPAVPSPPLHGGASNYVNTATTEYYYSCEVDGTVHGWWESTGSLGTGEIGVVDAP